jgi:glyoxylate/hydroxypyruvate reductase
MTTMADAANRAILLAAGSWEPDSWARAIRAGDPERRLFVWPDVPEPDAVGYALVWNPPKEALGGLANLKAIFSLGAGVDHLFGIESLPDVPVVRVVNPDLTQRMTEWVVLQVLIHHRQQRAYDRQQAAAIWRELPQPAAAEVRIGVMGLGVLGRATVEALSRLGFQVAGWSRRPTKIDGIATYHGADQRDRFLARTDILVCLLPLTRETKSILAMPLFERLARDGALGGPVLINAGRGALQVEADIIAAIESGLLVGASLDVFEHEPLGPNCPLWTLPNVVITPHAAAASVPHALVPPILRQIAAFEAGAPLENVVDREALY